MFVNGNELQYVACVCMSGNMNIYIYIHMKPEICLYIVRVCVSVAIMTYMCAFMRIRLLSGLFFPGYLYWVSARWINLISLLVYKYKADRLSY